MTRPLAIIAGVGPGTGSSVALRFAKAYTVIALARSAQNAEGIINTIKSSGGDGLGIATDVTDRQSIDAAFRQIAERYPSVPTAAAVFNVSGFVKKPFLELTLDDWEEGFKTGGRAAFLFSQHTLPLLLASVAASAAAPAATPHPPTLIFTGATASVKANAGSAAFAAPKWTQRALSQSLAREFGPKGVHVAHAIIDGVIQTPRTQGWAKEETMILPEAIAESYWALHAQHRSAWTWELDLRPDIEKW